MDSLHFFNSLIKPKFPDTFIFRISNFKNGQFGDLERVAFESDKKVGCVEFWSSGWVGMDVFDLILEDMTLNILCSPDEEKKIEHSFNELIRIVNHA